jgi:hypothetical protein
MRLRSGSVALLLAAASACAPVQHSPVAASESDRTPSSVAGVTHRDGADDVAYDVVSFVVVGDSITAGPDAGDSPRAPGPGSWIPTAEGSGVACAGGWAVPGATTTDMRRGVGSSTADAVVILAGTNDLLEGVSWQTTRANLLAIVGITGVADVVISTIPPLDALPGQRQDFDERLRHLAASQGWRLVDPWVAVDTGGRWAAGASRDGIHPTPDVAADVGLSIRAVLTDGDG